MKQMKARGKKELDDLKNELPLLFRAASHCNNVRTRRCASAAFAGAQCRILWCTVPDPVHARVCIYLRLVRRCQVCKFHGLAEIDNKLSIIMTYYSRGNVTEYMAGSEHVS